MTLLFFGLYNRKRTISPGLINDINIVVVFNQVSPSRQTLSDMIKNKHCEGFNQVSPSTISAVMKNTFDGEKMV